MKISCVVFAVVLIAAACSVADARAHLRSGRVSARLGAQTGAQARALLHGIDAHAAIDGGWVVAPNPKYANLRWADQKEKFNGKHDNVIVDFGAERKRYVPNLIRQCIIDLKIPKTDKIVVNAMGSTNPTSDYDITIDHSQADKIAACFNSKFEAAWHTTSAEVFDTNVYCIGWLSDKEAWGKQQPWCMAPLAETAGVPEGKNDITMRGYGQFAPTAKLTAAQMADAYDKEASIWVHVKAHYFMNLLSEIYKPDVSSINCRPNQPPNFSTHCGLVHAYKTGATNSIGWKNVGHLYDSSDSMVAGPVYDYAKKMILSTTADDAAKKLHALMLQPCTSTDYTSKFDFVGKGCCDHIADADNKLGDIKFLKMDNVMCRNRAYEIASTRVFDQWRTNSGKPCNFDQWHALVIQLREAEFYGQETYYTEGAFFRIVLADQAISLIPQVPEFSRFKLLKLSRSEIFQSIIENFADYVKELVHAIHDGDPSGDELVVQSSKYLKRLIRSSADLVDETGAEGVTLQGALNDLITAAAGPADQLAGQIRGKAMTPELEALRKKLIKDLTALYNDISSHYGNVVVAADTKTSHIQKWYRAISAFASKMTSYFFLETASSEAYRYSTVLFDGSQVKKSGEVIAPRRASLLPSTPPEAINKVPKFLF